MFCTRRPRRNRRLWLEALEDRTLPTFFGNALFPADNPWNQRITNAPVAANSATLVASIGLGSPLHPDFGTYYNGAGIGFPINVVSGSQPRTNVVLDAYADESDALPIPLPANAAVEGDPLPSAQNTGDRHVLVYDRDNNVAYETFNTHRPTETSDGFWHADSEAVWDLKGNSFRTPGFTSADAAGLPILPGLIRPDEVLDQGHIDHAIRITVPGSRDAYVYPASHEAGSNDTTLPRMGERFRLKQSFDLSGYSPANRVILQALKDYGMIVADNGAPWYLSGEQSTRWNDSDLHALTQLHGSDFEAVDLTPVVSGLGATGGPLAGGTTLTVTGLNFSGAAGRLQVFFGSTPAAAVTVVSDSQLTVAVPPSAAGAVDVAVQTPYGTSAVSAADRFTYGQAPPPPGPSSTPPPPAASANERFVAQLYQDVLRRPVDPSGLANGTSFLGSGHSRTELALAITGSPEYRALVVQDVYQSALGRAAEPGGLSRWVDYLGAGGTVEQFTALVLGSPEFFARNGGTDAGFVQAVYQLVLNRAPDAGGALSWGQVLTAGRSRQEVGLSIAQSAEARQLQVNALYQRDLQRPADPSGLSAFTTALQDGWRQEQVLAALVGSEEYFARV
jgi:Domain of unknown function (DUF4214)/IPT/TIG domain